MTQIENQSVIRRFLPFLSHYKLETIAALLLGIAGGSTSVLMTYYTGKGVDTMISQGRVDFITLSRILLLLSGALLVTVISQWLVQLLANRISYKSVAELRKLAFLHLNHLPINYFDQNSHGTIVSRFTNDLDVVAEACVAIFNSVFSGLTIVIISLFSMFSLSPSLTIVVLVATPCIFLVNWMVANTSQKHFASQQKIVGEISGYISEIVGSQKVVKAFQFEDASQKKFEAMNEKLFVQGKKAQFASSLTNPLARFVDHLAYIAIGLVGGLLLLKNGGQLTVGIISSFTIYASQFSKPFIELSGITTQIQTGIAGLERIFNMLDEPIETPDVQTALPLSHVKGKVSFRDISFSYSDEQPLIQHLNLDVQPGETVAIVGKTGAGKSTLVNLLMRFYEIDDGELLIDNIPIQNYSRNSLRQAFGMVLQDTWLFDGTIRENLTFGRPDASEMEIFQATNAAKIHNFITKLPEEYDTVIGSNGVKISEGERQLLTIARTMISQPPMLILDEATSSVDTLTEALIQEAFLEMMKGKTSFVIAHRLSTIREADKIIVMDEGKIVEIGTHDVLLQNPTGYYSQLYHAQFKKN